MKSPYPRSSAHSQFLLNNWETRIAYEILMRNFLNDQKREKQISIKMDLRERDCEN